MTSLGRTVTISFWVAFALSHFYLGFRLYTWVLAPVCRFPLWILACLMLFLGGSFQVGHNARKWPLWLRRFLIAVGGHWAGALLPLLLGFVGLDVLRLLFLLGGLVFPPYLLFYASLAILATVSLLLIWGTLCAVRPRVTRYTIPVHKKAGTLSSLRVALVSDVHLGVSIDAKQLRAMCKALQDLSPDLILIAGDLLDSGLPGLHDADKIQSVLSGLHAPHGVYVCLGNHDVRGGVTTEETIRFFQRCGLSVLHEQCRTYPGFLYPDWQSRLWIFQNCWCSARFGSGTRPRRRSGTARSLGRSSAQPACPGSGCRGRRTVFRPYSSRTNVSHLAFNKTSVRNGFRVMEIRPVHRCCLFWIWHLGAAAAPWLSFRACIGNTRL